MPRLTMKDLAERANVSWKTVSRVVNRKPGGVSAEKRAQIERLIAETGFRPNWAGRALSATGTRVIALALRERAHHYYNFEMQIGAMQACTEAGYLFVTEAIEDHLARGAAGVDAWLEALKPEGVIILAPLSDDPGLLDRLEARGVHYVRISPGRDIERGARVALDDQAAMRDITRHLIARGHSDIAYIGLGGVPAINAQREAGFRQALREGGIAVRPDRVPTPPDGHHDGFGDAEALLNAVPRPTAIVGASDSIAFGIIAAATKLGLAVPDDVSVVGFDNAPGSESIWPPLTTVNQPIRQIGRRATEMLVAMAGEVGLPDEQRSQLVPYEIVERKSTSAAAGHR